MSDFPFDVLLFADTTQESKSEQHLQTHHSRHPSWRLPLTDSFPKLNWTTDTRKGSFLSSEKKMIFEHLHNITRRVFKNGKLSCPCISVGAVILMWFLEESNVLSNLLLCFVMRDWVSESKTNPNASYRKKTHKRIRRRSQVTQSDKKTDHLSSKPILLWQLTSRFLVCIVSRSSFESKG